jgi:N4-gp56 family major capsid protein
MAATDFGALSSARKRVWSAAIWNAGRDSSFWFQNGFIGNGMNSVVQRITELTPTDRGDQCVLQLVNDLIGDGVVGDNILDGAEEALFNDSVIITIDQIRNGVRNKGAMAEQRTVIRFRTTAKDKLSYWLGDKLDELMFLTVSGVAYTLKMDGSTRATSQLPSLAFAADVTAPSSGRIKYAGTATTTATLVAGDTITWNTVIGLQAYAKRKRMRPIKEGGREYYIFLTSPEGLRDLKKDTTYQTNVGRAAPQGPDNPLFKNAVAVIDGVVIHEHNKVGTTLGLASGSWYGAGGLVQGGQSLLLGAQALGFAQLGGMSFSESDNTDYGNRPALGIGRMVGMVKPQFASLTDLTSSLPTTQDFGVVSFYHAIAAS